MSLLSTLVLEVMRSSRTTYGFPVNARSATMLDRMWGPTRNEWRCAQSHFALFVVVVSGSGWWLMNWSLVQSRIYRVPGATIDGGDSVLMRHAMAEHQSRSRPMRCKCCMGEKTNFCLPKRVYSFF